VSASALSQPTEIVVDLAAVIVWRSAHGVRRTILDDVDWRVRRGEHWGVVGPNGAGKSTLLRIASAQMIPSRGRATILGGELGKVVMPELRRRIGVVEPAIARRVYPHHRLLDIVAAGAAGKTALTSEAGPREYEQARRLLDVVGVASLVERTFASCSEGERARVLLARSLMPDAPLLVLDEPAAGLDVGGRELLLTALDDVARQRPGLTTVTVTHYVEELPATTSHLLLLRDGRVGAAGPIDEVANDEAFSECFDTPLRVERSDGRVFVSSGRTGRPRTPAS
jgi:iron complex transport system ATP-binding protein